MYLCVCVCPPFSDQLYSPGILLDSRACFISVTKLIEITVQVSTKGEKFSY